MSGKELDLSISAQQRQETQHIPPSVYSNIRGFTREIGMQTKEEFVGSIDGSIVRKSRKTGRERPVVIATIGEAGSFKTGLEREIVAEVFGFGARRNTRTSRLIRRGEEIPVKGIFWGESVTLTKSELGLGDVRFGEFTAEHNSEATRVFGREGAKTIADLQGKRGMVIMEGVGLTGMPWLKKNPRSAELTDVAPFGFDRGIRAFWDLQAKKGPFSGLEYDVFWLGVVAEPQIREMVRRVRGQLGDVVANPQQALHALRESGVVFDPNKAQEIIEWAHSSAPESAIRQMEFQTNDLIIKLGLIGAFQVYMDFMEKPDYRSDIIGNNLIPYVLRSIGVRRHIFIAHNYQPLSELQFNTSVQIENTILKRHPEVATTPNKRAVDASL